MFRRKYLVFVPAFGRGEVRIMTARRAEKLRKAGFVVEAI